jgi:hypothetical protein
MLAETIWLQSPDLVVIAPFGRFQGWEQVRDEVYVKFLKRAFSERDLRPSNVSMQVMGDSAWLAFEQGSKVVGHRKDTALAILRRLRVEPHFASLEIDLTPFKGEHLGRNAPT